MTLPNSVQTGDPGHVEHHNAIKALLDERITAATASATYERMRAVSVCYAGDSITSDDDPQNGNVNPLWPTIFEILSMGTVRRLHNAAVAGRTAAQVLAGLATEVVPHAPDLCLVMVGSNGASADTQAAVPDIASTLKNAGILPVFLTIPPKNSEPGGYPDDVNAFLKLWCQRNKVPLVDTHSVLVDPATGIFLAGYDADGTHPTARGHNAIAVKAWDTLRSWLTPEPTPLVQADPDGSSLVTGGLFLRAGGIGDSWSVPNTAAGATVTVVTQSGVPGKMVEIVHTAATGYTNPSSPAIPVTEGHRVQVSMRVQAVGTAAGGCNVALQAVFNGPNGGTYHGPGANTPMDVSDGAFVMELNVPAGATAITVNGTLVGGTGTLRIGQVGVRSLTALGIA